MSRTAFAIFTVACLTFHFPLSAQKLESQKPDHKSVTRVETIPDHLTVIEFGEPVLMVAVGNQNAYQVERRDNKVFLRPTEEGSQTNLFVWTPAGRYVYELLPAKAIAESHFAIDQGAAPRPAPPPAASKIPTAPSLPEEMLTDAVPVALFGARESNGRAEVTVRDLYQRDGRLYLRYALINRSGHRYQQGQVAALQLVGAKSARSLIALDGHQLGERISRGLRFEVARQVSVVDQSPVREIEAGGQAMGWLAVELPTVDEEDVSVLKVQFAADRTADVAAVLVVKLNRVKAKESADARQTAEAALSR
jgi:hypothetical protein